MNKNAFFSVNIGKVQMKRRLHVIVNRKKG